MRTFLIVLMAMMLLIMIEPCVVLQEQEEVIDCRDTDVISESTSRNSLVSLSAPWRRRKSKKISQEKFSTEKYKNREVEFTQRCVSKDIIFLTDS